MNLRSEDRRVRRSIRLGKKGKNWGRRWRRETTIFLLKFPDLFLSPIYVDIELNLIFVLWPKMEERRDKGFCVIIGFAIVEFCSCWWMCGICCWCWTTRTREWDNGKRMMLVFWDLFLKIKLNWFLELFFFFLLLCCFSICFSVFLFKFYYFK